MIMKKYASPTWVEEKTSPKPKFLLIPFLLTQNRQTITVCDNGFPNSCGDCEHRFICYTQAEKFVTLLEYRKIRNLDGNN